MRSLIAERMNKVFRENIEFLFDRFESQDLCAIVVRVPSLSLCLSVSLSLIGIFISGIGKTPGCLATYS